MNPKLFELQSRSSIILLFTLCAILFSGLFYWNYYNHHDQQYLRQLDGNIEVLPSQPTETHPSSLSNQNSNIEYPSILASPSDGPYPVYRSLLDVVTTWNPDIPEAPSHFVETLQHFNYSNLEEREMAVSYRNAELPFKIYNVPDFEKVARKWTPEYLTEQFKHQSPHVEKSKSNHFMYWSGKSGYAKQHDYKSPTDLIQMTYPEFLRIAELAKTRKLGNDSEHYYFMHGSRPGDRSRSFIAKDLPLFSTSSPNFFITNPSLNKGIQCRFGMFGIISEAHYDGGRNMVAMIKGAKRYILTPPSTCKSLAIISDKKHPSYRHSVIDWSDPLQAEANGFKNVDAIDTIVRQGEVLYIPSYWFHYIISLDTSIQCNSRSGGPPSRIGEKEIEECLRHSIKN